MGENSKQRNTWNKAKVSTICPGVAGSGQGGPTVGLSSQCNIESSPFYLQNYLGLQGKLYPYNPLFIRKPKVKKNDTLPKAIDLQWQSSD